MRNRELIRSGRIIECPVHQETKVTCSDLGSSISHRDTCVKPADIKEKQILLEP